MFFIKILTILLISVGCERAQAQKVREIFKLPDANLSVVVILSNDCENLNYFKRTLVNSAIWVAERINFLEIIYPLKLGLEVYDTCSEIDYLKTLFSIYENDDLFTLGVVSDRETNSEKAIKFSDVLGLKIKTKKTDLSHMVKACLHFLLAVGWKSNITLVTTDEKIVDTFYLHSKKMGLCIKECYIAENIRSLTLNATGEDPLIFFGTASDINQFFHNDTHSEDERFSPENMVIVPLDGDVPIGLPEGSFIILPTHSPQTDSFKPNLNISPTPLLFDIANPIINFAFEARKFLATSCNDTIYKINCFKRKTSNIMHSFPHVMLPRDIIRTLKIESLMPYFDYNIYRVGNISDVFQLTNIYLRPFRKIYAYNMFSENLTLIDEGFDVSTFNNNDSSATCSQQFIILRNHNNYYRPTIISFRNEAWLYAILSLALLGVLFCITILIYLLTALFQKRILEGNPVLTLFLLFAVMIIFCSVLPFSIETNKNLQRILCITKALSVTLSYAFAFSLLLSRCIMLGSAAKEIGFMSHIAGPTQAFLCLFIFGVQAALSLHIIIMGKCSELLLFTQGYNFVYLMSYDTMLLMLLVCLTPLIYKSQRNYREGKYFTIAIVLIAFVWFVWLPAFALLCQEWKELMICLGLIATGGILLGAIFIPRTFLMTIANERDKITSVLPSLTTATSTADIYRAHTQPIYDCINVAAINAAAVARAGVAPTAPMTTLQQPDLYSCPALPEDINFDLCCDSPKNTDKVTRF
ncbi:unnamed protein product [Ceutorhynchus assimilis]|uniref:G-protein coupled receptors family 3 profile domain-containing protein n=1 Tax=Ceutorhynchus assimilis TaxID=467358 RepID=A0A9N9MX76_9CUCU|nr:unnamed protein product [Ceutorhynchus assimilis]